MVLPALAPLTHSRLTPLWTWVLFVSLRLWTLLWFSFLCTPERTGGWEHSRQGNTIMNRVPGFPGPRLFHPQGPARTFRAEHSSVQPRESQGDCGAAVGMEVLFSLHRDTRQPHSGLFPVVSHDTRRVTIDRAGPGPPQMLTVGRTGQQTPKRDP